MEFKVNNEGLVVPVSKKDIPLFMHCSNGMSSVSQKYFKEVTIPLLFLHEVYFISWTPKPLKRK